MRMVMAVAVGERKREAVGVVAIVGQGATANPNSTETNDSVSRWSDRRGRENHLVLASLFGGQALADARCPRHVTPVDLI
jgi:hypothetical protein